MEGGGEATDWESSYRDEEWPWDLGGPAPPLVDWLRHRPPEFWGGGPILVPGCGRGHDAAALAAAGHEVLAVDLSAAALRLARDLYGAASKLVFLEGDVLDPDLAARHPVSAIFEHTCFCALPPDRRDAYAEAAARWLPPGGVFAGLFFIDPPAREDGRAGPPYGASRAAIRRHFAPWFSLRQAEDPRNSAERRAGREWAVEMVRNP